VKLFFACFFLICTTGRSAAQTAAGIQFIENKGQWNERVRYKAELNEGAFFLTSQGFVTLVHDHNDFLKLTDHASQPMNGKLRSHAVEMKFVNALAPAISQQHQKGHYNNYLIGNDPAKWRSGCTISEEVVYRNVYPNIDVRYYVHNAAVKYDIIVKPGGNIDQIAMRYNGTSGIALKNGELLIHTSVGTITQTAPYTYQDRNGRHTTISSKLKLTGNVVKFDIGSYDKLDTLIIDPELVFSTFSGSTADNWGLTATYGTDGSMFTGCSVFGPGFPCNTGPFQSNFHV